MLTRKSSSQVCYTLCQLPEDEVDAVQEIMSPLRKLFSTLFEIEYSSEGKDFNSPLILVCGAFNIHSALNSGSLSNTGPLND